MATLLIPAPSGPRLAKSSVAPTPNEANKVNETPHLIVAHLDKIKLNTLIFLGSHTNNKWACNIVKNHIKATLDCIFPVYYSLFVIAHLHSRNDGSVALREVSGKIPLIFSSNQPCL
jgi:hypothetical protein